MPTLRMTTWLSLPWIPRRVLRMLAVIILLPGMLLLGALLMAEDQEDRNHMKVAALALAEDMQNAPPANGWTVTSIGLNENFHIEMNVEVSLAHQAEFIKTRHGRVQYSYLKLVCPSPEAKVYTLLPKFETVRVNLNFNNELIVTGVCPKSGGLFG